MFVATALAVIVGAASGGTESAIILYEAALGLGISTGPLLGAVLGGWHWRYPFFGTAALMAIGFVLIATLLRPTARPATKTRLSAPIRALGHGGLSTPAFTALFYNYAFFTILAFTPFVLHMDAHGSGLVFFGWGVLLALCSVFLAPVLQRRMGSVRVLYLALTVLLVLQLAIALSGHTGIIVCVILTGVPIGINNTVFTEAAMEVSEAPDRWPRPGTTSSAGSAAPPRRTPRASWVSSSIRACRTTPAPCAASSASRSWSLRLLPPPPRAPHGQRVLLAFPQTRARSRAEGAPPPSPQPLLRLPPALLSDRGKVRTPSSRLPRPAGCKGCPRSIACRCND
jgi:MFS family permease